RARHRFGVRLTGSDNRDSLLATPRRLLRSETIIRWLCRPLQRVVANEQNEKARSRAPQLSVSRNRSRAFSSALCSSSLRRGKVSELYQLSHSSSRSASA